MNDHKQAGENLCSESRKVRENMNADHATRRHRGVSWLRCAEQYSDTDDDISFIALWIAFNALYATDDNQTEHTFRDDFDGFGRKLVNLDSEEHVHNSLWMNFSGFVRLLIEHLYAYGPFWQAQRDSTVDWEARFAQNKKCAMQALTNADVPSLLRLVMERLYVIRNQMVHGGATWQS